MSSVAQWNEPPLNVLISDDVTAQVRLDSFRQTTVQNFLDSGF